MKKKQSTNLKQETKSIHPKANKSGLWKDGIKRQYTVVSTKPGKTTKRGKFIQINAIFPSPYREGIPSETSCQMLETKSVKVY